MNKEIEPGQMVLMIANEDGSFSPVGMSKAQSMIINSFLSKMSENEPLIIDHDKYIKKQQS